MLSAADVGRVERLVALRSFPGWRNLPSSELMAMVEIATALRVPRGTRLLHDGQRVDRMYLVVEGEMRLTRGGHELGRFGPYSGVGGLAAFARDERGYDCDALEDSVVLEMRAHDLEEVLEERFLILSSAIANLCRQAIQNRLRLHPDAGFPEVAEPGAPCPARPLDLVEKVAHLRGNIGLGHGRIDALVAVAREVDEVRLVHGTELWAEGDRAETVLAIVCGTIEGRTGAGHHFRVGAGDFCGSLEALSGTPRWFSARVDEGLVGLRLRMDRLLDVLEDHRDLGLDLLQAISAGLLSVIDQTSATQPPTRLHEQPDIAEDAPVEGVDERDDAPGREVEEHG
ncbi:MAG: cyclic nucleotide-binding domain-containing protein [Sandaracinaceae bacterium]